MPKKSKLIEILLERLNDYDKLASVSNDETIKIWNLDTITCIKTLIGHNGDITSMQLCRDNQLISSSADRTIKLWNLETETCVNIFTKHTDAVKYLAIL